jgi:hypothetical protein
MSTALARAHALLAAFAMSAPTELIEARWAIDFNALLDQISGDLGTDLADLKLTTDDVCHQQPMSFVRTGRFAARLHQALTFVELQSPGEQGVRLAFPPDC